MDLDKIYKMVEEGEMCVQNVYELVVKMTCDAAYNFVADVCYNVYSLPPVLSQWYLMQGTHFHLQ